MSVWPLLEASWYVSFKTILSISFYGRSLELILVHSKAPKIRHVPISRSL